jgi:hypothetical protein
MLATTPGMEMPDMGDAGHPETGVESRSEIQAEWIRYRHLGGINSASVQWRPARSSCQDVITQTWQAWKHVDQVLSCTAATAAAVVTGAAAGGYTATAGVAAGSKSGYQSQHTSKEKPTSMLIRTSNASSSAVPRST